MDIVQTIDAENVPNSPSSPNLKMNLVIGFMLGLMVSLFSVLILEFLDQTVKNPSNIVDDWDMPFLVSLPYVPDSDLY